MKQISPADFSLNPFTSFNKVTPLCTAAKKDGSFNTMTIGWGAIGVVWGKNALTVYIRPQRYTHEFMDEADTFTVSFFGDEWHNAMTLCGTKSGRDTDKVKECGFTPVVKDNGICFAEAKVNIVCKKLYVQRMEKPCFVSPEFSERWYPAEDFHDTYIGEIVSIYEE